jgi:RNA 3'-terminal phosphate cyclase (ATP)
VIEIDGSIGEGGGQVLRSALTLSLLTGQAFGMTRVRASRPRPGLFPQHLAAVQAAAQISAADVAGDRIGSRELHFAPGPVQAGRYHFDIGTAGATSLVLQTLLLPLALAEARSSLSISGGTHVPWSPCFHYLDWHWRPLLARLGIEFQLELAMAGFYPQGGGELRAEIPGGARPVSLNLPERGGLQRLRGLSAVANLPLEIAERQRSQALRRLGRCSPELDVHIEVQSLPARSPGTLLLLLAEFEHSQACFFSLGARGKRAERVADEAADDLFVFLDGDGVVDRWMADQLLLPLALAAGASAFRTADVSSHLLTNAAVIRAFLPVRIVVEGAPGQAALVRIQPGPAR